MISGSTGVVGTYGTPMLLARSRFRVSRGSVITDFLVVKDGNLLVFSTDAGYRNSTLLGVVGGSHLHGGPFSTSALVRQW
jgi:hypothetical protein